MGLLDFISKTSTTQGGQTDPAVANTQQGSQFSDIQYPMPTGQTQAGDDSSAPVTTAQPTADYSQYTYNPTATQANNFGQEQVDEVADITQTANPDFYNQSMQEVEDLTQYGSQASVAAPTYQQPVEQNLPQVTDNNAAIPQYSDVTSYQPVAQPETQLPVQPETPQVSNEPQMNEVVSPVQENEANSIPTNETNIPSPTTNPFNPAMDSTSGDSLPPLDNLQAQSQTESVVPENTVVEDNNVNNYMGQAETMTQFNAGGSERATSDDGSFDINNLVSDAPSTMTNNFVPEASVEQSNIPTENLESQESTAATDTSSQPAVPAEDLQKTENLSNYELVVGNTMQNNGTSEIKSTMESEPSEATSEQLNPPTPEVLEEPKEEVKEEEVVAAVVSKVEESPVVGSSFKVIKDVAFLGLNSKTFKNVSTEINSLVGKLVDSDLSIYIDSNKGYGEDIIKTLETSNKKSALTSVYFKPFYSSYSDESDNKTSLPDLTTVIYSDLIERTKYFIREAEAFVFPETSGLVNFGLLNLLLSIQFLYSGQHKPVILLGNKWGEKMAQIKTLGGFSEEEFNSIKIATTADEAFKILQTEDLALSQDQTLRNRKFFDYREDFDEYEYMN